MTMTGMMKKSNKSLRMGDNEAVLRKTGRKWQQWFTVLDSVGAAKMPHKQIAEYLMKNTDFQDGGARWLQ